MAIKITKEEVIKVAGLARLDLTEDEVTKYAREISAILNYVGELNEVNTENTPITSQVTGLSNVLREDKAEVCGNMEEIISVAPASENNLIKVKAVFE